MYYKILPKERWFRGMVFTLYMSEYRHDFDFWGEKVKDFDSAEEARQFLDKLITNSIGALHKYGD